MANEFYRQRTSEHLQVSAPTSMLCAAASSIVCLLACVPLQIYSTSIRIQYNSAIFMAAAPHHRSGWRRCGYLYIHLDKLPYIYLI